MRTQLHFPLFGVGAWSFYSPGYSVMSFFSLYSCLLHIFRIISLHLIFVSGSYMYVSTHSHIPCSRFYIFICVSLRVSLPCQSRFSKVLNYVCHTCLLFLLSCHLNLLYSHHPSWYSHLRSFYQVLISISQFPCLTSIHQIRSDDGLVYCHFKL